MSTRVQQILCKTRCILCENRIGQTLRLAGNYGEGVHNEKEDHFELVNIL